MENTIFLEKFGVLPIESQKFVLDLVDFLFEKYVEEQVNEIEQTPSISEDLKKLLDERIFELENFPEKILTLAQVQQRMKKKHNTINV